MLDGADREPARERGRREAEERTSSRTCPLGPRTSAAGGNVQLAEVDGRLFASFSSKSASCALRMTVPNESVLGIPGFGLPLDMLS